MNGDHMYEMAYALFDAENYEDCIRICNKLIVNGNEISFQMRGNCYYFLGKYEKALSDYKVFFSLMDDDFWLSYIDGLNEGGKEQIRQLTHNTYRHMGEAYAHTNQYENAIQAFNNALKFWGPAPGLYLERGKVHIAFGEDKKALADFKKCKKFPGALLPAEGSLAEFVPEASDMASLIIQWMTDEKCSEHWEAFRDAVIKNYRGNASDARQVHLREHTGSRHGGEKRLPRKRQQKR